MFKVKGDEVNDILDLLYEDSRVVEDGGRRC